MGNAFLKYQESILDYSKSLKQSIDNSASLLLSAKQHFEKGIKHYKNAIIHFDRAIDHFNNITN